MHESFHIITELTAVTTVRQVALETTLLEINSALVHLRPSSFTWMPLRLTVQLGGSARNPANRGTAVFGMLQSADL